MTIREQLQQQMIEATYLIPNEPKSDVTKLTKLVADTGDYWTAENLKLTFKDGYQLEVVVDDLDGRQSTLLDAWADPT